MRMMRMSLRSGMRMIRRSRVEEIVLRFGPVERSGGRRYSSSESISEPIVRSELERETCWRRHLRS